MLDNITGVDTNARQIVIDAELVVRGSTDSNATHCDCDIRFNSVRCGNTRASSGAAKEGSEDEASKLSLASTAGAPVCVRRSRPPHGELLGYRRGRLGKLS